MKKPRHFARFCTACSYDKVGILESFFKGVFEAFLLATFRALGFHQRKLSLVVNIKGLFVDNYCAYFVVVCDMHVKQNNDRIRIPNIIRSQSNVWLD